MQPFIRLLLPLGAYMGTALAQVPLAKTFTTIQQFNGTDGAQPDGTLIRDQSGALYGTALNGGSSNLGTVFQVAPTSTGTWTLNVLHNFAGAPSDGASSLAAMIFDKNGALYGTTTAGGANKSGVVFRLTPPATTGGLWTEDILYSFTGASDGAFPYSALVFDSKGALYGTTLGGGSSKKGTVFRLAPPSASGGTWTESVIYSFTGASGSSPFAGVVFGPASGGRLALYGTTSAGGAHGAGTVFRLTPASGGAWKETVIHSFGASGDGASPYASVVFDSQGNLYGTTFAGGSAGLGAAFELAPPTSTSGTWSESVIHSFTGGSDGSRPFAALVFGPGGRLLSSTAFGGSNNGGVIFSLLPPSAAGGPWTETIVQNLNALAQPGTALTPAGANLFYGLTYGGSAPDFGTVFQLTL